MFTKEAPLYHLTNSNDTPQKTIPSRTQNGLERFDIRNFQHELEATKVKDKYICPVCGGHNLSIDQKTGKYRCFNNCECKDIREEIKPLAQAIAEQKGDNYTPLPRWKPAKQKIVEPKPVPIPGDFTLVTLSEPATDIPQPQQLTSKPPKEVLGNATEIIYSYSESQWVTRYQWEDVSKDKGYSKTFRQWHRREDGIPEMRKGDEPWAAYRLNEAICASQQRFAIAASKSVEGTPALLQVEGEKCVEILRLNQIAAITFQGSSWIKKSILPEYERAKQSGIGLIIFLHDNDDTGLKKAQICSECAAEVGIGFIAIDPLSIYPDLQSKGDIEQILAQMETPEFIRRLEQEIHAAVAERSRQQQSEVDVIDADDSPNNQDPVVSFTQQAFKTLYGDCAWICAADNLYWHTGNHYKHSPDSREIKRISDFCNSFVVKNDQGKISYPYATPSSVKKVLEWAKMRTLVETELINPPGVNCLNGIVKIEWEGKNFTVKLKPHTPEDYYIYEPLIEYLPNADDTYCNQLLSCLDEPQQQIFLRNVAASLDLKTVRKFRGRAVKGVFAIGLGANGKDSLRECVSTIYGKNGLTSVSLGDFQSYDEGRKFGLSPLMYSLVNWPSENGQTTRIDRLQSLKLFITGDTLHCEHKGKDHIEFSSNAIGIFNLNETPAFQGVIQAIKDRIAVLEFKKTFVDNPDPNNPNEIKGDPRFRYDPDFIRTLVAPAFLNRMLQALKDLIESGIDYECTTEAFYNLQKENNHLFDFVEDEKLGYVEGGEISANHLWLLMENWYKQNGTLTIDENGRRAWVDQVRPSDKNVKGINQIIPRISQLFPKAVKGTRYCAIAKRSIPVLKGIGIIDPTRTTLELTRTTPAPLPAPETLVNQDFRTTRTTFSDFEKNIEEKPNDERQADLFSPPMKKEQYPPQSGAGSAEPLQNKENCCGKSCGSGAGELESGAGMPIEHEAVTPTTITSDTALVEAENDNSCSLLQIKKDAQDVTDYVGRQLEARERNGSVKFTGQIVECDVRNEIVTVATEQGNRDAYFSEAFVID